MTKRTMFAAVLMAAVAAPAAAQAGRIGVEPYAAYGFFGTLPDGGPKLKEDVAFGARAGYQLSPRLALYGNFQRATPEVNESGRSARVDHWTAGAEYAFGLRQRAEGLLPVTIEAGLGQTRYDFEDAAVLPLGERKRNDLTANVGLGSAFLISPNLAVRFGVNDYISNYAGDRGMVNHVFARVGAELRF